MIKLSDYETGLRLEGSYQKHLVQLQDRMADLQARHIANDCRTLIVFEGWDAAGYGGYAKRITAHLDPRYVDTYSASKLADQDHGQHFLTQFWRSLPASKTVSIWDNSHYGRVLTSRAQGSVNEAEWRRAYDEINEFESQQVEFGTNLIKIFLHITPATHDKILHERLNDPSKQWKVSKSDFAAREYRAAYHASVVDMFKQTDTRWAPWKIVDANNVKSAHIAVLEHIIEILENKLPKEFPKLDASIKALAKKAFGKAA